MNKANIALVSYESLGDSLIYTMMADNLRRNGYSITLFGNIPYQLKDWLPELSVKPYPKEENLYAVLDDYHLVFMSPSRTIRTSVSDIKLEDIRQRFVLLCQKAPKTWLFDHYSRLQRSLNQALFQQIGHLSQASGSIQYRKFTNESVVEITLDFMREKMGLQVLSPTVNLSPPQGLVYRKYRRRIIVSPDSAWPEKKDWTPQRFLKLYDLLTQSGYEPVIVVAPSNHQLWQSIAKNHGSALTFTSIDKLAEFIYESAAVVANDSGNGHLASFLGIPVLTIYRKRNPYYHWRPGWAAGKVVCPRLILPSFRGPIWRPFIGVKRVKRALDKLLQQFG